nr:restriction endonuclease subunit S [uncultured Comamonas sp.]
MITSNSVYPIGWSIASISELSGNEGIFLDGDWVESKDQDPDGKIRLLQLADIGDGKFSNKSNRWINEDAFLKLRCTEVLEGDVLIARMPDPLGRSCIMPSLPNRSITVVDVAILRCSPFYFYNHWLMHWINSPNFRRVIESNASGTTRKRIARGRLGELEIPIPPLAEQRRIADKLDTTLARVDALNDRLARITPLLKRFRQSVLAAATSGRLTEDWREVKRIAKGRLGFLGELGNVLAGQSPSVSEVNYEGRGTPYVTGPEQWDGSKLLTHKWTEFPKRIAPEGSIFITVKGAGVGKTFPGCYAAIGRDVYAFVVNEYHEVKYVLFSIQASAEEVILNAKGLIPGLTKKDICEHVIYIPHVNEQTEIVRRVEILFAFADRLEARLHAAQTAAERLTPALLAKAFRGELVPQDPNDEPASALLARLVNQRALSGNQKKTKRPRQPSTTRVPTTTSTMTKSRQDKDVKGQPYLAGHLRSMGEPSTVESLFKAAQLSAADFYKQLAWEIEKKHVKDNQITLEPGNAAG